MKAFYPYVAIAVLLALIGSFFYGSHVGAQRAEAKYARTEALIAKVREEAQQGAAVEIAKIKVVNQTHRQVIEREIRNIPTGSCVLSPDGVSAINEILAPGTVGAGRGELPKADSPL